LSQKVGWRPDELIDPQSQDHIMRASRNCQVGFAEGRRATGGGIFDIGNGQTRGPHLAANTVPG
jgi:hypothetical protein